MRELLTSLDLTCAHNQNIGQREKKKKKPYENSSYK